jgi:hypothetical protein
MRFRAMQSTRDAQVIEEKVNGSLTRVTSLATIFPKLWAQAEAKEDSVA